VGLILGTGTNACYLERIENIVKFRPDPSAPKDEVMVINMESGNFGSRPGRIGSDLPLTKWDRILNKESNNRDNQLFEKQISGMYLGEIVRIILVDLIDSGKLFVDFKAKIHRLEAKYEFPTKEMSDMEVDKSPTLEIVGERLAYYGITKSTLEERKFIKSVIHLVAARGAILAAAQIAACLKQMNKEQKAVVIAVDGSVFDKYPGFKEMMDNTLAALLQHRKVQLVLAVDGSGVGAALASFMANTGSIM